MATLGKTAIGGSQDFIQPGTSNLQVFGPYTLAQASVVSKISCYMRSGSSVLWYGYIYADSAGAPAAHSGHTTKTTSTPSVAGWFDATFASPLSLAAGTYWIGVMDSITGGSSNLLGVYDASASGRFYSTTSGGEADGFSGSFPAHGSDTHQFSVYATYTVAPANTVAPAVTGTATVGSVLSTTDGTWTGDATIVFTYQWQRGGVNISSATANTYTLVDADDATNVRCVVTGTNTTGNASANSNAVAITEPVPTNSVAPAVTGTTAVGDTLTCSTGTWLHMGGTVATYTYQWKRDGTNIGGATAATHVIVTADLGTSLTCFVTATNTGGAGTATSSNSTSIPVPSTGTTGNPALVAYIYTHRRSGT